MKKRGQFYILAAIMIILAVSGMASIATYAVVKSQPRDIYNFAEDITRESAYITDFGIIADKDVEPLLINLTTNQFANLFLAETENASSLFVYGNSTDIYVVKIYEDDAGAIVTDILGGGTPITNIDIPFKGVVIEQTITPKTANTNHIRVKLLGAQFKFDVKDSEMFYFVILETKDGEVYIIQNE